MKNTWEKIETVLIRLDYNVPVHNGRIVDLTRIHASKKTIDFFLKKNKSIIIMSHFGRPLKKEKKYSLEKHIQPLEKMLNKKISFIPEITESGAIELKKNHKEGTISLLENLRFYQGETKNEKDFARLLSNYGDIYINDAFGASHRHHASISKIKEFFPKNKYRGYLIEKEIQEINKLKTTPPKPYTIIVGGSKIGSKIHMLKAFLGIADNILIGGGMAFPFIKHLGGEIGKSICKNNELGVVQDFLKAAKERNTNIVLPVDCVVVDNIDFARNIKTVNIKNIPTNKMGVDIGPKTIELFLDTINNSQSIMWNGPMGISEIKPFSQGTERVARSIAQRTQNGVYTIIGGGDTIAATSKLALQNQYSYVSTGGGAMLEFCKNIALPGLVGLEKLIIKHEK